MHVYIYIYGRLYHYLTVNIIYIYSKSVKKSCEQFLYIYLWSFQNARLRL